MLPPPGFGFSVGDFLSGLELIRQLIKALEDSSGSSKEYRDLIRELYSLERALIEVKSLNIEESPQKRAVEQVAVQCQQTISFFLEQIAKYQPSLGGLGKSWRGSLRKVQWALYKKEDVQKFRAQIQGHTSSITILLLTLKLNSTNLASQPEDSTRSQSCCSHHNQLVQIRQSVDETTSFLRSLSNILPLLQRIDSANNSQFQNNLCNVANEIRESNLQIYRTFLTMQSALPPQVERQQPVYFHDACGLQSPFHLEFINSWEAFVAVLSVKFKQRGLFVVEKKQYVLEDANHRRLIDMNRPFEACFFPGQQVNMDACFDENSDTANCCPVCRHAEFGSQDEAIDGSRCGTHYQRIEEIVPLPKPGRSTAPGPERKLREEGDGNDTNASEDSEDEILRYRRIRLRRNKVPSEMETSYQFTIASPDEEMHGKAVALFDFAREYENELPLIEGQIIFVSSRHGKGWLIAEDPKTGEDGLVPEEYVRLLKHIDGGPYGL